MLPATILFFVAFNSGEAVFQTVDRTKLVSLVCMLVSAGAVFYSLFVISINFGKIRSIEVDNEKISFYRHPYSQNKTTVYLSQIIRSSVTTVLRSGIKVLIIESSGSVYRISDTNLSEREFSYVCNAVVKFSLRCKACQSSQVSWSGEQGHCHNCETITPVNTDSFDWKNAYQA
jgi:hypothetical protein